VPYFVYIIRNKENKLYIGQTYNLEKRLDTHNKGFGTQYTKISSSDFRLVYSESFDSRLDAMKRERQLKKWSRVKKEALISGDIKKLKES
jgi:predicted GIY-YIG superfamily endonuclease